MLVWVFKGEQELLREGGEGQPRAQERARREALGAGQDSPWVSTENKHVADGLRLASEEPWVPAVIPELACIQEPLDILRQGN